MFHTFIFIYSSSSGILQYDQLPVGLIAQLVEHRTGILSRIHTSKFARVHEKIYVTNSFAEKLARLFLCDK